MSVEKIVARIFRSVPQPLQDAMDINVRASRFGELATYGPPKTKHFLADEGSYFIATNPTPGTAIVHVVLTAFDDTKPYLLMRNQASPTDPLAKRIYLDYVKLLTNVVPASAVEWGYTGHIDYAAWAARYTSGGSLIAPVNANGDISTASNLLLRAGAITAVAGVGSRFVARGRFRGVVPTIYDEYVVTFGACEGGSGHSAAASAGRVVSQAPPVVIGAGQNFALNLFGTSNAATPAQFEFEIGYWER
jgi:hypothetical protein